MAASAASAVFESTFTALARRFPRASRKVLTLLLVTTPTHVLLGMKKRGFGEGRFNGFGGKVEKGETIEAGALRELEEESGVRALDATERGLILFEFEGDPQVLEVHLFHASRIEGEPHETEEMAPQWFAKDSIPFDRMWLDDELWFPLFLAGKTFRGYFVFRGQTAILHHVLEEVDRLSEE